MAELLELGQAIFGNPTGNYGTHEYTDALIEALLSEIERVYWNKNQNQWDRHDDPKLKGVEFRPYDWSENEETIVLPNLKFSHSPQEIRWYKHSGRGQSSTLQMDEKQWREWFDGAMEIMRSNEEELF